MAAGVVNVSSETWDDEVAASDLPVLVDFWGPGCPPCVALAPTIEALAQELAGQVKVCKVNVEEDGNEELLVSLRITGIPCLILFRGGTERTREVGWKDKDTLRQWLKASIA